MRANRMGKDNEGPAFHRRYPEGLVRQGVSAELIAARWEIGREAMDQFALGSHRRARCGGGAWSDCRARSRRSTFRRAGRRYAARRARRRPAAATRSLEKLALAEAGLRGRGRSRRRFPEIRWSVTAGNSSQVTDGAAAVLIAEEVRRAAARPQASRGDHAFCACRRRSRADADGDHSRDAEASGPRGTFHRPHRRLRGQRGLRLGRARVAQGNGRRSGTRQSAGAARSRSAIPSAPRAGGFSPIFSRRSKRPAAVTACRRCASPAAWPTRR